MQFSIIKLSGGRSVAKSNTQTMSEVSCDSNERSRMDTLEKNWNTAYDWILKWYPLVKDDQLAFAKHGSGHI